MLVVMVAGPVKAPSGLVVRQPACWPMDVVVCRPSGPTSVRLVVELVHSHIGSATCFGVEHSAQLLKALHSQSGAMKEKFEQLPSEERIDWQPEFARSWHQKHPLESFSAQVLQVLASHEEAVLFPIMEEATGTEATSAPSTPWVPISMVISGTIFPDCMSSCERQDIPPGDDRYISNLMSS